VKITADDLILVEIEVRISAEEYDPDEAQTLVTVS
jgi:hypothetical protein